METRLKNSQYKHFLILLKAIPIILSFIYFVEIILMRFKIEYEILSIISFTSILSLSFLYFASYIFQFCAYHRMFLHYISFITIYNIIDLFLDIPIKDESIFSILMIITFIFMVITLYKYLNKQKGGRLWQR